MRSNVSSFNDYLVTNDKVQLHPKVFKLVNSLPKCIKKLHNLIFYGPKGVGKYTQVLSTIKNYSPSELKYEKKMSITFNKGCHVLKISDIHFEVDMSLLGCNTKLIWNEVFNRIVDVILTKPDKAGIILCKNFHETHAELLESFYSYMQNTSNGAHIIFFLVSEAISFIPDNIVNSSYIIHITRPSKTMYNKCLNKKLTKNCSLRNINNIKLMSNSCDHNLCLQHKVTCDNIISQLLDINNTKFSSIRENIYDTLIYDMDICECIWYIIENLIKKGHIKESNVTNVLLHTYSFFRYYNNNYRPIYHLESFICYLTNTIHGFETCV